MTTELERVAMRRQGGNSGKETPGQSYQMCRFGNSRKVHGRFFDTGLGHNAKERASLRGMEHRVQRERRAEIRNLNRAPVRSRPFSSLEKHLWFTSPCNEEPVRARTD